MKISGLTIPEYLGFVLFADAFSDIIEEEEPELVDEIFKPGMDILSTTVTFFKNRKVDPFLYVDERPAMEIIRNLSRFWKGQFSVEDLAKFDKDSIITLGLQARGHGVSLDDSMRVERFFKQNNLDVPRSKDIGVEFDERPSIAAYRALEKAKENV